MGQAGRVWEGSARMAGVFEVRHPSVGATIGPVFAEVSAFGSWSGLGLGFSALLGLAAGGSARRSMSTPWAGELAHGCVMTGGSGMVMPFVPLEGGWVFERGDGRGGFSNCREMCLAGVVSRAV